MTELVKRLKSKSNISDNNGPEKPKSDNYDDTVPTFNRKKNSLRVLSRIVIITSLLIVVYFTSADDKTKTFAKQSEMLVGKGQMLQCTVDYMNALVEHGRCFIKECKRYVSDKIITAEEADGLLKILQKALKEGESAGGASTLDLHSGHLSKGDHFINVYYKPDIKKLFTEEDFQLYANVKEKVRHAVAHHFGVNPGLIYPTRPGYFSALTSKNPVTPLDKYWQPQIDYQSHRGNHFSAYLYLNNYNTDFKGGRFIFTDQQVNRTVEPRKGRVLIYTSGPENRNYIERVTYGTRYAVNIPFTCNKDFALEEPSLSKNTL